MLKIKVEGYKEAKAILDELPNSMQKRMLRTALRSSSKPMLQSVKSKVPTKSGTLKKQLRTVSFRDRNAPKSEVDVAVKPVLNRTKKKGAINQYYGKFIHEGTADPRTPRKKGKFLVFEPTHEAGAEGVHSLCPARRRKTAGQNQQGEKIFVKSVKGIKPTPFLEQAYSESSERTISIFGDELAKAVEKFVNKNFKQIIK